MIPHHCSPAPPTAWRAPRARCVGADCAILAPKMLRGRRGLLNELRKLASRLDRPITADDVHFGSKPLYAALLHHFGTFPEARRAAGLPGPQWGPLKWSAAKVHAELRRLDRAGVRLRSRSAR